MTESPVVTVRGLRKSYGDRRVVDHLDLDVHAGEIVGLIGANGAGKTTTVECIQGLRRPDAGTLRVIGLDPVTHAERLRPPDATVKTHINHVVAKLDLRNRAAAVIFALDHGVARE